MSLESVTEVMRGKMSMAAGLDAKVKFDFGDDGVIFVDATQNPPEISHEDDEADCTLKCTLDTFKGLMDGSQDPTMAFMMGKLKVDGSMGLAMKLNSIIED
jgi:putative sterol carrier protein